MKHLLLFLVLGLLLPNSNTLAQANHVVISEVYGGGGNTGAIYNYDYVELYNPTGSDITMTSWAIQYGSASNSNWTVNTFSGVIKAKSFFLIRMGTNSASVGGALPSVDATLTSASNLSASSGRLALTSSNTVLTGAIPASTAYVDYVGYGSTTGYETAAAPLLSNTTALERKAVNTSTATTLATGGEDANKGNGYDSDDNSKDFVVQSSLNPQSTSSASETLNTNDPAITLSPSALSFSNQAINTISNPLSYSLKYSNLAAADLTLSTSAPFSVSKTESGTYSGSITFSPAELTGNSITVYVRFSPVKAGSFDGTISHSGGGLSNAVSLNLSGYGLDPDQTTFNFANCSSTLSDGFTSFSVAGAQTWACTSFGHDPSDATNTASLPNGVQINGYANSVNNSNEDWLITPPLNIGNFTYPLLSFWSRNKYAGSSLQLKISTNYSGIGSPYASGVTWVDLNGKFPATNTDVWTLSSNIDLSAFKSSAVFIAFVYTSSTEDGARWTLDDISVSNSLTAPPAQLMAFPNGIDFGYQAENTTSAAKNIQLTLSNLSNDVLVSAPANFMVSADNTTFSSQIALDKSSYINKTSTIYVKFSPTAANKSYTGSIMVTSPGAADLQVALAGSTISNTNTLEVVNWNVEWFAGNNGPSDDTKQKENVLKVLKSLDADIYCLGEVVNVTALADVVSQLGSTSGDYGYYVSDYASYAQNSSDPDYANAQKLGFIYRKSVVSPVEAPAGLLYTSNEADPVFNYWASGRFPFQLKANVTLNGISRQVNFIMIHAKAETSSGAYTRRVQAANALKSYLDANEPNANFLILGDYNDDLDYTISEASETGGSTNSSYKVFTDDSLHYKALTLPLSKANKKSTTGYNDVIDHVIASNEMYTYYLPASAQIQTGVESVVAPDSYSTTTSDHYPVLTRYSFDPGVLPLSLTAFSAVKANTSVKLSWKIAAGSGIDHFEVERSVDGKSFTRIDAVPFTGIGTYSAADQHPVSGDNYYRIKEVNADNESNFSTIEHISFLTDLSVNVYPNPFTSTVTINAPLTGADINLVLASVSGSTIYKAKGTRQELNSSFQAVAASLNAGTYILTLNKGSESYQLKLLKK